MSKETELTNKALVLISIQLQLVLVTKSAEHRHPDFIDGIEKTSEMLDQLTSAILAAYE